MANQLVKAFNALPHSKGPAGTWHFDLRYNPLEPGPCHVLILMQHSSGMIHVERLPIGLPIDQSGIEFFPETPMDATPEITRAILHIFVNKLNRTATRDVPGLTTATPLRLTTRDPGLALLVGCELKKLSVRPLELRHVAVCTPAIDRLTDVRFNITFQGMKKEAGYKDADSRLIPAPDSLGLSNLKLDPVRPDPFPNPTNDLIQYIQMRSNGGPPTKEKPDMGKELAYLMSMLHEDPDSQIVKEGADSGDAADALEYAIRLYVGVGCKENRPLAHHYAAKAATLPTGSDSVKVTAHGLLIDWNTASCKNDFRKRYMYAASHHANESARLSRAHQIPGAPPASPYVLAFMNSYFDHHSKAAPDLKIFYKDAMWASRERAKQLQGDQAKMQAKKRQSPLRYRCAAVGCGVEADRGKMLAQCAGKCDPDKKPSYCSKECQKKDWKHHKPYCHPGAECSVIDDGQTDGSPGDAIPSSSGALQVPIRLKDGSMQYVSSSTMGAEGLKELRDALQDKATGLGPNMSSSVSISLKRL